MADASRRVTLVAITVGLVGLIGLGWVLGVLAVHLLASPLDRPALRFVVDNRSEWVNSVASALTTLGAGAFLLAVVMVVGLAWWARRGSSAPFVMLLLAWLGAEVLFNFVKVLVDRARPPAAMAVHHFDGLAFPSGHATTAVAVWGMVAALLMIATSTTAAKVAVGVAAAFVALAVGATRVYLGAHWMSDVIGGWLLGSLWLFALLRFIRPTPETLGAGRTAEAAV